MRYLVLLSLLLVGFSTSLVRALETPPNVLWRRDVTDSADHTTSTFVTDCKVLPNGNLALAGQFSGQGPILGAPFDPDQDPLAGGSFVALQSPNGELLWLHRFPGINYLKLHLDAASNISVISCAESVSILGSTLPAEPVGWLLYSLSFKPDGTLNHLRRLGQMEGPTYLLRTSYLSLVDGSLLTLEFKGPLTIADKTYTPPDDQQAVLLLKLHADGTRAWDHVFYSSYTTIGESLPLPDGGQLYWANFSGAGTYQGQTYGTASQEAHSLLVWLNAAGEATKTARIYNPTNAAYLSSALLEPDGDLILQLAGRGQASITPQTGTPLSVALGEAYLNVALARVSGNLSELRWQKRSEDAEIRSYAPLCRDQAGHIYAAFFTSPLFLFFGGTLYGNNFYDDYKATSLLKLDTNGNVLWQRFEKSPLPVAFDVSPDGQCYLGTGSYITTPVSRIVSIASGWELSPPEFLKFTLTNQLVVSGTTLSFLTEFNSPAGTVYYWSKNGAPFTNSSISTLNISNVSAADLGSYSVTASNQFGSVTSGPFTFTLAPASQLAISQTLGHIHSSEVYAMKASFSSSGRHYLCSVQTGNLLTATGIQYFAPTQLHCRVSLDSEPAAAFTVTLPSLSFPSQLIGDDGSCFFMSTNTVSIASQRRSWLTKVSPTGDKLWEIDVLSTTGGYFKDLALLQKTNLVLSAYCKQGTIFPGQPALTQSGLYLIRLSLDGVARGTKLLLASETELGRNICLAPDGSGYTLAEYPGRLTFSNGNTLPEDYSHPTAIFGFDSAGNLTWAQRLPSQTEGQRHLIACDSQGVVVCVNHNGILDVAGFPSGSVNYGTVLVRWRKDGLQEWQRVIDDPDHYESVGGLAVDAAGNVVFGLTTEKELNIDLTTLPTNPGLNEQNFSQAALIRLSRTGRLVDTFRIPSSGGTGISSVAIDPTGRLLYSGQIAIIQSPNAILQIGDLQLQQKVAGQGAFYSISTPLGPPLLVSRQGSELTFSWSDYLTGFSLESSTSPLGPWNPVSITTNSFTLDTSSTAGQFFRLKEQTE